MFEKTAHSQTPITVATLVRTTETSMFTSPALNPAPDPAGITYLSASNHILISDSEVNEMQIFSGTNLFETTLMCSVVFASNTLKFSNEPTGLSINPGNKHLYVSDDDRKKVFEVDAAGDGKYGTADDMVSSFSTSAFGSTDPEGVAYGQGNLFIVDGVGKKVYQTTLNGNIMNSFDVSKYGTQDPEGITYNADNNTLFIVDRRVDLVIEVIPSGTLVREIDISDASPNHPAGIVYAPTSNPNDDQSIKNLYIVDRGVDNNADPNENDGKLYEMSIGDGPVITSSPTPTSQVVVPGDADNDGDVDIDDYLIWLNNYNQLKSGPQFGDFNNTGKVDGLDYIIWLTNYGT
jgi:uncharacterized protein YjiK